MDESQDKVVIQGLALETVLEHIYMCDCGEVLISGKDEATCSRCNRAMEPTGWFESNG